MKSESELKEEIEKLESMDVLDDDAVFMTLTRKQVQLKTLQERNAEIKQAIKSIEIIRKEVGMGCNNEKEKEM